MKIKMVTVPSSALPLAWSEGGKSDVIYTKLTCQEIKNAFVEFGQKMYRYDSKKDKIILKKNFSVNLNLKDLGRKRFVTLKFTKTNNSYIWLYPWILLCFLLSLAKAFGLIIILTLIGVLLLDPRIAKIRRKHIDYSEEANRVFLEISDAIREKEMICNVEVC